MEKRRGRFPAALPFYPYFPQIRTFSAVLLRRKHRGTVRTLHGADLHIV